MHPDNLISNIEDRHEILEMQRYADIYVTHKKRLFPLMEQAVGEPLPSDLTHQEAIDLYTDLLNHPQFADQVDDMFSGYVNAIDPVTAIAELGSSIANIFGRKQDIKLLEQQAEMQEEGFFQQMILNRQKQNDSGKILLITGISAAVVGLTIFLIVKARR